MSSSRRPGLEQVTVRELPDGRLSLADATRYLGDTAATLANMRSLSRGPRSVKVGGRRYFYLRDLDALIRGRKTRSGNGRDGGRSTGRPGTRRADARTGGRRCRTAPHPRGARFSVLRRRTQGAPRFSVLRRRTQGAPRFSVLRRRTQGAPRFSVLRRRTQGAPRFSVLRRRTQGARRDWGRTDAPLSQALSSRSAHRAGAGRPGDNRRAGLDAAALTRRCRQRRTGGRRAQAVGCAPRQHGHLGSSPVLPAILSCGSRRVSRLDAR